MGVCYAAAVYFVTPDDSCESSFKGCRLDYSRSGQIIIFMK
uniref:Uncharacterized protein n=1 Tax=Anguilla anguilla TaxID=7936 RepID=A0A0E9QI93_ANGAN